MFPQCIRYSHKILSSRVFVMCRPAVKAPFYLKINSERPAKKSYSNYVNGAPTVL